MIRRKRSRALKEINAGSMADIAFLLLIFFLVTTTMDTDVGILRLLPPVVEDQNTDVVKERNVYLVLVNDADMLLVEDDQMDIKDLREGAKEFLTNPDNREDLPEKVFLNRSVVVQKVAEMKGGVASATDPNVKSRYEDELKLWQRKLDAIELLGEYKELPGAAVISLQTGSKTSYNMYVQVQNELQAAVRELRDELSLQKFGVRYSDLNDLDDDDRKKIRAIRQVFPQRVSEAEPVEVGQTSEG